jgi:hypothetical protein
MDGDERNKRKSNMIVATARTMLAHTFLKRKQYLKKSAEGHRSSGGVTGIGAGTAEAA